MSSNMLTVIDYSPDHLKNIRPKSCHERELPKTVCTRAVTIMSGDTPLAIVGSFVFLPGVMHVWAVVSEDVKKCPISFHKACLSLRDYYEKSEKSRRLQIDVRCGHEDLGKWATKLGFSREGVMRAYGPDGSDYWLYGRVNPWAQ